MTTVEMSGIENIEGQRRGTLLIVRLASRRPVRWHVQCDRCGLSTIVDHMRLQNGSVNSCPNPNCGRTPSPPRASLASTGQVITASRSRTSAEAREFTRQTQQRPVNLQVQPMSTEVLARMEPEQIASYLRSQGR